MPADELLDAERVSAGNVSFHDHQGEVFKQDGRNRGPVSTGGHFTAVVPARHVGEMDISQIETPDGVGILKSIEKSPPADSRKEYVHSG